MHKFARSGERVADALALFGRHIEKHLPVFITQPRLQRGVCAAENVLIPLRLFQTNPSGKSEIGPQHIPWQWPGQPSLFTAIELTCRPACLDNSHGPRTQGGAARNDVPGLGILKRKQRGDAEFFDKILPDLRFALCHGLVGALVVPSRSGNQPDHCRGKQNTTDECHPGFHPRRRVDQPATSSEGFRAPGKGIKKAWGPAGTSVFMRGMVGGTEYDRQCRTSHRPSSLSRREGFVPQPFPPDKSVPMRRSGRQGHFSRSWIVTLIRRMG